MIPIKRQNKILRYANRVGKNSDPVSIQASITDYCFNKCAMCNHHKRARKKILNCEDWINFLNSHPKIESVCYAGGDPFTNPYINKIMEHHKESGQAFGFICCGFIPDKVDMDLLEMARWVRVSLDSINPDAYACQRGGLPLDLVLSSINSMIEASVNVELTITVTDINCGDIKELIDYAAENGLCGDIHPAYGTTFAKLGVSWIKQYCEDIKENVILSPYSHGDFYFQDCYAPYYQLYIDANGDIYPCCTAGGDTEKAPRMHPIGSIYDWDTFLKNRKKFTGDQPFCQFCLDRFGMINKTIEDNSPFIKSFF